MPKKIKKASPKPSKSAAKKTHSSPKKKTLKAPTKKSKEIKASKTSKPAKAQKVAKEAPVKKKAVKVAKVEAPVVHGRNGKAGVKEAVKAAAAPVKAVTPISVIDQPDVQEKLRELIKLAKEQGYLTFDDLNEALPDNVNDPDEMETIMGRLRTMEIEIIEASDVDRFKDGKKAEDQEEEEEKPEAKLDILDDPVRMYLKQMGQVPLLTR